MANKNLTDYGYYRRHSLWDSIRQGFVATLFIIVFIVLMAAICFFPVLSSWYSVSP